MVSSFYEFFKCVPLQSPLFKYFIIIEAIVVVRVYFTMTVKYNLTYSTIDSIHMIFINLILDC